MNITIHYQGKKIVKDVPTSWEQVMYYQFLELAKCGTDIAKILSVFTGVEEEVLKKVKIQNIDAIIEALSFLEKTPEYILPKKILGYPLPNNLEFHSIAQFEDLKLEAAKFSPAAEDGIKNLYLYPSMVATYCVNDPYSWQAAELLAPSIAFAPCQEVLAIGNFILVKLIELKQKQKPTSPKGGTLRTRLKLVTKAWLRNMVFSARWYLWKKRLERAGLNF